MSQIPDTLQQLSVPVENLQPYSKNPRRGDVGAIKASLEYHGQYKPIVVRSNTFEVLAGNHTLQAAKDLGWADIAATFVDVTDDEAARIVLVDNRSNDVAGYDDESLQELLAELPDLAGTGFTDDDLQGMTEGAEAAAENGSLVERFGVPPFSVLDARGGAWRSRKAAWKDLGIHSEVGRDADMVYGSPQTKYANWYEVRNRADQLAGRRVPDSEVLERYAGELVAAADSGTSIFDPVLTELMYRWFCPPGGHVLDPWAGGSVRGLVAARLGRQYTGIELREEQVAANRDQRGLVNGPLPAMLAAAPGEDDRAPAELVEAEAPAAAGNPEPYWIVGESTAELQQLDTEAYDFVIGCPPYYDLEVYSDDPRDMSNMAPADFDAAMIANVQAAAARLRPNSYAAFVVSAVRNRRGNLMDMRSLMIRAAGEAGLSLQNDAILVTPIGTLAVRAGRSFTATRSLARGHQDVLIFLKGDRKAAAARASDIETQASLDALEDVEVTDGGDS